MLQLCKGESTKSYENYFFRLLAAGLTNEFDKRGWNGLLMGMPKSLNVESLQIDCLLVTDNQIILIDFKNYDGDLELPDTENFDTGSWLINGETKVRGGSSINPYKQLGKQRAKLIELIDKKIEKFDKNTVFTIVCFHGKVKIIGEIPRQIIGFSIVDSATIIDKIIDIIDVKTGKHEYMKPAVKSLFTDKLFFAPDYQLSTTLEVGAIPEKKDVGRDTDDASQSSIVTHYSETVTESTYDIQIQDFLKSEDRVLIVSGNTMSGKTELIPRIREIAFDLGYFEVPVFVYSNRFKNRMQKNFPSIEGVDSLYGEIFDFQNEDVDENYKKKIPVKVISETEVENHQGGELFIIDDSQFITNSSFDSETLQFGTGCLLDDLFSYLQLNKYPERKIVVIGDTNRISYGSEVENAMNADYLVSYLNSKGISTNIHRVILPPRTDASEIIKVCNKIAENINTEKYSELIITNNNEVGVNRIEHTAILEATYKDPNHNKILVYTNEQAKHINFDIKKKLAQNGSSIGAGDIIVFNSTIKAYSPKCIINEDTPFGGNEQPFNFDEPKRINNGSFAAVIAVDSEGTISLSRSIHGQTINLTFIPCQVKLQDSSILQIYVFDNYLRADKAELETLENIAYKEVLSSLLQDFMLKYTFEDSDEFKNMEMNNRKSMANTGKPYYILNDKGEYRLEKDGRSLPPEIKEFRKRIENKLLTDSSTDYFKIYNAARIKYAWALTVNKAMAYTFENVYFNTSQGENHGRTNKDYFKWLYTGFATAESKIELIDWIQISPFMHAEFSSVSSSSVPKAKNYIFVFSNKDDKVEVLLKSFIGKALAQTGWRLVDVYPSQYLEKVKLQKGEASLELFFDYNGKGEVKTPRLKAGSKEDLEEVVEILKSFYNDNTEIKKAEEYNNMGYYFNKLRDLLKNRNIKATIKIAQKWSVYWEFTKENERVEVQCWYNSHGMISKFNRIGGCNELFDEIVLIIKEKYSL